MNSFESPRHRTYALAHLTTRHFLKHSIKFKRNIQVFACDDFHISLMNHASFWMTPVQLNLRQMLLVFDWQETIFRNYFAQWQTIIPFSCQILLSDESSDIQWLSWRWISLLITLIYVYCKQTYIFVLYSLSCFSSLLPFRGFLCLWEFCLCEF